MKSVGAEESNQSDDDQIKGDDIVQQPRYDKNENPGDQRYQGSKSQGDIHGAVLSLGKVPELNAYAGAGVNEPLRWEFVGICSDKLLMQIRPQQKREKGV
jgi:hypothetical protein